MHRSGNLMTLAVFAMVSLAAGLHLQAQPGNEAYYSTDIDDAVAHAQQNPVDKGYVGKTWYNRSTSQSFDFPKMLNSEMNEEVIEGAVGATAAGDQRAATIEEPVRETSLGRQVNEPDEINTVTPSPALNQSFESSANAIFVREINYSDNNFSGASRDIRADVTISAQPTQ